MNSDVTSSGVGLGVCGGRGGGEGLEGCGCREGLVEFSPYRNEQHYVNYSRIPHKLNPF